ncbi:MAG: MFS transporter [Bacteroidota bacterium]
MKTIKNIKYILPILMSFFVMSFCDLVGIGVDRVKPDFHLSDTLAQLIPSAVFVWFFFLSVPIGILQDRIGKRKVLNAGVIITAFGLFFPFFVYSYASVLLGFAFLGIGNTIVQVSANPLLVDVVPSDRKSSFLSFSQFVKAVGSMIAPPFAAFLALQFGDWKILFLVFGIVSILTAFWLGFTKIKETQSDEKRATFISSFKLLSNGFIALLVVGIFLLVGLDVGINAVSGQFLMNKFNLASDSGYAQSARSIYFLGKMLGTFGGAFLLAKFALRKFFVWNTLFILLSIILLILAPTQNTSTIMMFIFGLSTATIFPIVFTLAVDKYPIRSNEISGLMIMAVSGGAFIPLLIGILNDSFGLTAGMLVLVACSAYLLFLAFYNSKERA